jgi:large subunit ribosomal protein L6
MSRIGKLPVNLPKGVTVSISDTNEISVKGPLVELKQNINKDLKVEVVDSTIIINRPSDSKLRVARAIQSPDCKHGNRCIARL